MSEERRKILDMLAAEQISVDDAQRLLDKVEPPPSPAPAVAQADPPTRSGPRYLRIHIVDDDDKVELQIPLALIRTGIRLGAVVPDSAKGKLKKLKKLKKEGFDIDQFFEMASEELVDSLAELEVNIEGEDGERVRLFCE